MTGPPAPPSPRELLADLRRGIDSIRQHPPGDQIRPIEQIPDLTLDDLPAELAGELRRFTERTGRTPRRLAHYIRMEDGAVVGVFDDAGDLSEDQDLLGLSQTVSLVAIDRTTVRVDSFIIELSPAT